MKVKTSTFIIGLIFGTVFIIACVYGGWMYLQGTRIIDYVDPPFTSPDVQIRH